MRKILLTVMMVSSLLAFNACTKDGAQGPAGAAGTAGTPGAPGTVGKDGAKGADGTKILSGTAAPAASAGADGDFFFDKTAKVLYGPKADGAWGEGVTLTGAGAGDGSDGTAGEPGADGKDGSSFLAGEGAGEGGKGAPAATVGTVGDYFFNTVNSTFYGPKAEDGSWATGNQLPLGSASGVAKNYYYTVGFTDVKEVKDSKKFGQDIVATYPDYRIFSTYKVNADDVIRIAEYAGWGDNRVMAFETVVDNNVFTHIPATAALLAAIPTGTRFIFANDYSKSPAIFNLSQADKDRLTENPANFDYLLNAKAEASTIALGKTLNFANAKNLALKASTTKYMVKYEGKVAFDLEKIVPNLERYKQDGKVYAKVKYYDLKTGKTVNSGGAAGWWDGLSLYINRGYITGGVKYGPNLEWVTEKDDEVDNDVFDLGLDLTFGDPAKVGTQEAIFDDFESLNGKFEYTFDITSGDEGDAEEDQTPKYASKYYSQVGDHLTAATGLLDGANMLTLKTAKNGQDVNYFKNQKLFTISILVIDAEIVAAAKKAGLNVDDVNAMEQFVSKR